MSNGMRVDLSALDEVIRKLWTLLDDMDKAGQTSRYQTDIPRTAFGSERFQEAGAVHSAHLQMKSDLEKAIEDLHGLINRFGKNTSKVKDAYTEQEYATKHQMNGDSSGTGADGNWDT